jgi:2-aminoadipate transaminase
MTAAPAAPSTAPPLPPAVAEGHGHGGRKEHPVNDSTATPPAEPGAPWAAAALESLLNVRARALPAGTWAAPAGPGVIPLTGGIPDPETLPFDELQEATRLVLRREGREALEYGGNAGYPGLRELIAARVDAQGLGYTADNVTLTGGSAQALHNIFETFIDPGDTVVVEAPAWGGVIRTLRAFQAHMETVPLDEEGIVPQALDDTLGRLRAEGRRVKLIYTIPTFQNPMGITATVERRRQLLDIAARYRVLVLEDDAYGELRFAGARVPTLLALSGGDGVLRCSTFSKTIATGLRVGWIQGAKEYIDAAVKMRFDNGTSPFTSRIIAAYIEEGYHEPHVAKMCAVYRAKCDAMLNALAERCPARVTWTRPEGGFFVWLTLPETTDPRALARAAAEEGVQYIPGPSFYATGGGERHLRLAYSYVGEEEIVEAIRRLARAIERATA